MAPTIAIAEKSRQSWFNNSDYTEAVEKCNTAMERKICQNLLSFRFEEEVEGGLYQLDRDLFWAKLVLGFSEL